MAYKYSGILVLVMLVGGYLLSQSSTGDEATASKTVAEENLGRKLQVIEGWSAKQFFEAGDYQAMCSAIEKGDLKAIEDAAAKGLNLNTAGKDGMTLLMWAYATDQFEAFEKLLVLGADPNQVLQVGLKAKELKYVRPKPGDNITIVVFADAPERWWKAVVNNRGNLNSDNPLEKASVLTVAVLRKNENRKAAMFVVATKGVNLNYQDQFGRTPAMNLLMGGEYELAAKTLEAGASADCYNDWHEQLIDQVARRRISRQESWEEAPESKKAWEDDKRDRPAFERLVLLLAERGYDLTTALVSASRANEKIRGVPYFQWRREQRGHMGAPCPGLSTVVDERPKSEPEN